MGTTHFSRENLKELVKAELHGVLSYYKEPVESIKEQTTLYKTADYGP